MVEMKSADVDNYTITIDTGTTNTRVTLWKSMSPVDTKKGSIGVQSTAVSGSNEKLVDFIRSSVNQIIQGHSELNPDTLTILGSGMLTSDIGLIEVPRLIAPVGISDLSKAMCKFCLPGLKYPIWLIPGVQNSDKVMEASTIYMADVMRGEETEVMGALTLANIGGPAVLILPGTHTKVIQIDSNDRITQSLTTMAGEMLALLTKHSILADSLGADFAYKIDCEHLLCGYHDSEKYGLSAAAFKVRMLDQFSESDQIQRANYLLGAVLSEDLKAIKNSSWFFPEQHESIYVFGKPMLRKALCILLNNDSVFSSAVYEKAQANLAGVGAILVAKNRVRMERQAGGGN